MKGPDTLHAPSKSLECVLEATESYEKIKQLFKLLDLCLRKLMLAAGTDWEDGRGLLQIIMRAFSEGSRHDFRGGTHSSWCLSDN